jgi:hypothetical protein
MGENKGTQDAEGKRQSKQGCNSGKRHIKPQQMQSLNSDNTVPMLRFGIANNFDLFKRKMSVACMEIYKNLGRLITDEVYYEPPVIDNILYDITNDPHDIEKGRLKEAYKMRDKEVNDMRIDRTSMYAYLLSKLSKESQDEIQGHADWVVTRANLK